MPKGTKGQIIDNARAYLKSLKFTKQPSLATILRAIGISKGTFYYYFKDADELIYAVIIPDMEQKESEINKKIAQFATLHERLHFMFEIFSDEKLTDELNEVENFYAFLFLDDNIAKSKAMKQIIERISKTRKSLIMQQIRYYNIKITKDINILVDYVIDTMIFYHIFHKKLKGKSPRREIISVIDMLCRLLEREKSNKKRES